jgi:hypothetical protein
VSPLDAWDNFYVIVGSSGAGLTGLQFVVMALVAESRERGAPLKPSSDTIDAFGTPTVVHFSAVLLLAAYAVLGAGAAGVARNAEPALFVIGAANLLLLVIGIYNSWDTVTYVAITRIQRPTDKNGQGAGNTPERR